MTRSMVNIITVTTIIIVVVSILLHPVIIIQLFVVFKVNFFVLLFLLQLILSAKGIFVPLHHQSALS